MLLALHLVPSPREDLPSLELFAEEDFQPALHQAAGLLHARDGWEIDDALALIRAHSYAADRPVAEVAEGIIHGRVPLA